MVSVMTVSPMSSFWGTVIPVSEPAQAGGVMAALRGAGVDAWELGRVVPGTGRVQLDGVAA